MQLYTNQDSRELLQALNNALPYIEHVLKYISRYLTVNVI